MDENGSKSEHRVSGGAATPTWTGAQSPSSGTRSSLASALDSPAPALAGVTPADVPLHPTHHIIPSLSGGTSPEHPPKHPRLSQPQIPLQNPTGAIADTYAPRRESSSTPANGFAHPLRNSNPAPIDWRPQTTSGSLDAFRDREAPLSDPRDSLRQDEFRFRLEDIPGGASSQGLPLQGQHYRGPPAQASGGPHIRAHSGHYPQTRHSYEGGRPMEILPGRGNYEYFPPNAPFRQQSHWDPALFPQGTAPYPYPTHPSYPGPPAYQHGSLAPIQSGRRDANPPPGSYSMPPAMPAGPPHAGYPPMMPGGPDLPYGPSPYVPPNLPHQYLRRVSDFPDPQMSQSPFPPHHHQMQPEYPYSYSAQMSRYDTGLHDRLGQSPSFLPASYPGVYGRQMSAPELSRLSQRSAETSPHRMPEGNPGGLSSIPEPLYRDTSPYGAPPGMMPGRPPYSNPAPFVSAFGDHPPPALPPQADSSYMDPSRMPDWEHPERAMEPRWGMPSHPAPFEAGPKRWESGDADRRGSDGDDDVDEKDRKYVCGVCGKAYRTSSHLARHRRSHADLRPFICPNVGCHRTFYRADHLKQHMRTHDRGRLRGYRAAREARRAADANEPRSTSSSPETETVEYQRGVAAGLDGENSRTAPISGAGEQAPASDENERQEQDLGLHGGDSQEQEQEYSDDGKREAISSDMYK
ncbi:hypothetical protein M427DRAFT_151315 [Gonapodya prolifera JEL478]|uniref:C2H2-type domain-containing protein n=1 Tax=Gonapodya prolifera (strain JEL478) TaxID=1344416 RepID=A0A139AWS9_GONPJ|nr:hypothetical protein M427DRAFT_151315 [Gonapodya prolifera JEL478]|eukprot:KXS21196.1 hypothetical protein M427DRAFT_151315 [Gonapodya prolifera JEL478]